MSKMTIRDLPLGAKIKHSGMKYNNAPIIFIKVTENGHYDKNQTIFVSKEAITRKPIDAKEPKNSNNNRQKYGNNDYELSNLDQWLNSKKTNWYTPRHNTDQAPSEDYVDGYPYDSEPGFLCNFTDVAIKNIEETSIKCVKHAIDGGRVKSIKRKIFIPSLTEMDHKDIYNHNEGVHFPYFSSYPRRGANEPYWFRSYYKEKESHLSVSRADGTVIMRDAYSSYGIRPSLSLCSDTPIGNKGADGVYEISFNKAPKIIGDNEQIGEVSDAIELEYSVTDADKDTLTIIERLNNTVIDVHNNKNSGFTHKILISREELYKLPLGERQRIQVEADDGQEKTYKNWFFTRTNTAPVIKIDTDKNIGTLIKPFTSKFIVSDVEGDKTDLRLVLNEIITVDDNIIKEEIKTLKTMKDIQLNNEISFTISDKEWIEIQIGDYELDIIAEDSQGGYNKESISFSKSENMIKYTTNPVETEDETDNLKTLMGQMLMHFLMLEGAKPKLIKVEACNNAFDENPTWENITEDTINMTPYNFKNKSKTSDKWGVSVRVEIRGDSDESGR